MARSSKRLVLALPSSVRLPFGYRVKVMVVEGDPLPEDCDGLWDDEDRTIYIRRSQPATRKRYILTHELLHAWLDWQHYCLDAGVVDHLPTAPQ